MRMEEARRPRPTEMRNQVTIVGMPPSRWTNQLRALQVRGGAMRLEELEAMVIGVGIVAEVKHPTTAAMEAQLTTEQALGMPGGLQTDPGVEGTHGPNRGNIRHGMPAGAAMTAGAGHGIEPAGVHLLHGRRVPPGPLQLPASLHPGVRGTPGVPHRRPATRPLLHDRRLPERNGSGQPREAAAWNTNRDPAALLRRSWCRSFEEKEREESLAPPLGATSDRSLPGSG